MTNLLFLLGPIFILAGLATLLYGVAKILKKSPTKSAEHNLKAWKDAAKHKTMIIIKCHGCHRKLRVPDEKGIRVTCPTCGHSFMH